MHQKLTEALQRIAEARLLVPTLRSIGDLSENWTSEGEAEMADAISGLHEHLFEIEILIQEIAALAEIQKLTTGYIGHD